MAPFGTPSSGMNITISHNTNNSEVKTLQNGLEALNRLGSVEFYAIVGEKQFFVSKTSSAKERTPKKIGAATGNR
jgi:hypothetical protein